MTIKTLTATLLLATTLLLFTGCDSKTKTEVTQTQNPTAQHTPEEETSAEGGDDTTGGTTQNGGSTGGTTTSGGGSDDNTTTGSNDNNTTTGGGGANDDNTTTNPTPATTIASLKLTIDKTSLNKDETTIVKVMATYSDNSTKEVTDKVEWEVVPNDAVKVTGTILTALQDKQTILQAKLGSTLSEKITLDIYWEVNGYRLPPEPDPTLNDATLLGVDSNDNDVRDDIERKVYATYPKAIQRAVMMQAFRAKQKMLADSDIVGNARNWEKKITKYIDCTRYLYMYKKQVRISRKQASLISEWQFNNKERVKIYIDYNKALSGGVYSINKPKLEDCEFNIEKVLEMDK